MQVLLTSQRGQVHSTTVGTSALGFALGSSVGSSVGCLVPPREHSLLLDWQGASTSVAVGEKNTVWLVTSML